MRNQVLLDLGLPVDRMPEAEVALRLGRVHPVTPRLRSHGQRRD